MCIFTLINHLQNNLCKNIKQYFMTMKMYVCGFVSKNGDFVRMCVCVC